MDKCQNKDNSKKDFLQSFQWKRFQESVGRKTHFIENDDFSASIVEHVLPIVGKYFYCPRGPIASLEGEEFPISNFQFPVKSQNSISNEKIKTGMRKLIELAKRENAGWIRIEPENAQILELIKENISQKFVKAPHDMQPKEIFVLDISKSEEQLLVEMKPKTRYNINLAKKKGVEIKICHCELISESREITGSELNIGIPDHPPRLAKMFAHRREAGVRNDKDRYVNAFLRLTMEMAARQGIVAHPEEYYRKMIETLPEEMLKIYVAEYDGKIIAANLVLFFENTAIYLHGASSNENRNVMAPFLLQWQAILDAKKVGCTRYDFGGIRIINNSQPAYRTGRQTTNNWEGITNFKLGFSPNTKPVEFPGSYDIIINPRKYAVYRGLQRAKAFAVRFRR